ncbi:MAG: response regulator [Spirochaetia bacterium]|nr:response regulator [Spirochaetia bacterium]
MNSILILEQNPVYQNVLKQILSKNGYNCIINEDETSGLSSLENNKFKFVLIDLDIAKHAKKIIDTIIEKYKVPLVLTCDENIEKHYNFILKHEIMQILIKPIKSDELLTIANKLCNFSEKNLFGLTNYLSNIKQIHKIEIISSNQIRGVIAEVMSLITQMNFASTMKMEISLVLQEILTNAVYHSHGFSDKKEAGEPLELPSPYKVIVEYGMSDSKFGISVRDYCGTLIYDKIINPLKKAAKQQALIEDSIKKGIDVSEKISTSGRGLDLIRRLTGEHYFIINPNKSTEIITIYDGIFETDSAYSGLRIFQLPDTSKKAEKK